MKFAVDNPVVRRQTFFKSKCLPLCRHRANIRGFVSSPARKTLSLLSARCAARSSMRLSSPIF
jgi:hypothetical protein